MDDARITIKDIAKAANVSVATVSRALAGNTRISAETRERINELCRQMHYTPNFNARSMVMRETKLIGVIISNARSPFMTEVSEAIEYRAQSLGYSMLLCNSRYDIDVEEQMYQLLLSRQVDGIIISATSAESNARIQRHHSNVPIVFIGSAAAGADVCCVATDNVLGAELGTKYLLSLGHTDIAFLGRRFDSAVQALRAEGYERALRQKGLAPQFWDNPHNRNSIEHGRAIAHKMFQQGHVPTAVFATTDIVALGVMQAAEEAGVRIPDDMSLLGFDDISYAGLPRIDLTTIHQPKQEIGTIAVDMLIDQIHNPAAPHTHRSLQPTLVERSSCAAPRRA